MIYSIVLGIFIFASAGLAWNCGWLYARNKVLKKQLHGAGLRAHDWACKLREAQSRTYKYETKIRELAALKKGETDGI